MSSSESQAEAFQSLQLQAERIRQGIADSIEALIANGTLRPGDRLPSERDLAKLFGLGRPTVREAIRLLEQRGLLEMRPRSGAYVTEIEPTDLAHSLHRFLTFGGYELEDLLTFRELLEPKVAELAAKRATAEEVDRLRELVDTLYQASVEADAAMYAATDASFHMALATASHSELFVGIMGGLEGAVESYLTELTVAPVREEGRLSHRLVVDAVAAGDPPRAKAAMAYHMTTTRASYAEHLGRTAADLTAGEPTVVEDGSGS